MTVTLWLLQDLARVIEEEAACKASLWIQQDWFAEPLASVHNSKGTADNIREEHRSAAKGQPRSRQYFIMAYLRLMRNVLVHAELAWDEAGDMPDPGPVTTEDVRLMKLCPLGFGNKLVT